MVSYYETKSKSESVEPASYCWSLFSRNTGLAPVLLPSRRSAENMSLFPIWKSPGSRSRAPIVFVGIIDRDRDL